MAKYSLEFKKEVVEYYLAGKGSFTKTSKKFCVDRSDVRKWVAAFNYHGIDGLTSKHGTYTGEFKLSVLKYMQDTGSSARNAAAHFNIPGYVSVCKWERIYFEEGLDALFIDRRGRPSIMSEEKKVRNPRLNKITQEDLITENQRLRMENDFLKKKIEIREHMIQEHHQKKSSSKQ